MITANVSFGMGGLEDASQRLLRLLNENIGNFTIDKDGIVATNFDSPAVKAEMQRQILILSQITVDEK